MSDARLKSIVERLERLAEERSGIASDMKDIFTEAKSDGYDVKVLRRLLRERGRDAKQLEAEEAELARYKVALGMAVDLVRAGVSLRDAARATGASKSSIHRALAVPALSQQFVPHDSETGEIHESSGSTEGRANRAVSQTIVTRDGKLPVEADEPMRSPLDAGDEHGGGHPESKGAAGVEPGPLDTDHEAAMQELTSIAQANDMYRPLTPIDHAAIEADDLAIPPFLKRERATA